MKGTHCWPFPSPFGRSHVNLLSSLKNIDLILDKFGDKVFRGKKVLGRMCKELRHLSPSSFVLVLIFPFPPMTLTRCCLLVFFVRPFRNGLPQEFPLLVKQGQPISEACANFLSPSTYFPLPCVHIPTHTHTHTHTLTHPHTLTHVHIDKKRSRKKKAVSSK